MSGLSLNEMSWWRSETKKKLEEAADFSGCNILVVNPCDYYNFETIKHQTEKEVMDFDLHHVKTSDIVIVNLEGLSTSDGSKIELYEAYRKEIPVIAIGSEEELNNVHSWLKLYITRREDNIIDVVTYIHDFYMR